MMTFGAYFSEKDPNNNGLRFKGPSRKVAGTGTADIGPRSRAAQEHNPDLGAAAE